ncbi:MAG: sugar phosphate nucleotidyltransferase, partial [Pseudomonadota bacterium]
MSRPDTAMIFAAGRGTRMRELTQHRPKPMIPLAGRPLIDHALDRVAEAGLRRAVVNTHYLPDALEAHLAQETRFDIALSHEPTLLETGGGLKKAAPLLRDGPVWTLNADAAWAGPSPFAAPDLHPVPGGACLLLVPKARAFAHPGRGNMRFDPGFQPGQRGMG